MLEVSFSTRVFRRYERHSGLADTPAPALGGPETLFGLDAILDGLKRFLSTS
jgi:hypothetical protein